MSNDYKCDTCGDVKPVCCGAGPDKNGEYLSAVCKDCCPFHWAEGGTDQGDPQETSVKWYNYTDPKGWYAVEWHVALTHGVRRTVIRCADRGTAVQLYEYLTQNSGILGWELE
jgi:hypothetical protein|tara:strand:- start:347 stop:685 length:339 start_codon:yes stop_codon:yes gene_type:complete